MLPIIKTPPSQLLGTLYASLSGILYGSIGYFGVNIFAEGISVPLMLFWRFLFASLFMLPFTNLNKIKQYSLKQLAPSFILGAIFYSLSTYAYFTSSKYIGTGIGMVLFYTYPLFIVLMLFIIDKKRLSKLGYFSIIVFIVGMLFLTKQEHSANFHLIGIILGLISAILYAIYFYVGKKIANQIDSHVFSLIVCVGNTISFLIICLFLKDFHLPTTNTAWVNIIGISLIGTTIPLFLLFISLKTISATKAALISVLEPVVTFLVGVIIIEEPATFIQAIGVLLILIAAVIIQFDKDS